MLGLISLTEGMKLTASRDAPTCIHVLLAREKETMLCINLIGEGHYFPQL